MTRTAITTRSAGPDRDDGIDRQSAPRRSGTSRWSRPLGRLLGVAVVVAFLSGCWEQVGFGPEHRRFNDAEQALTRENVAELSEEWTVALPAGTDSVSEPIVSQGRVFVAVRRSHSADVRAVNLHNGVTAWDRNLISTSGTLTVGTLAPVAVSGNALWTAYSVGNLVGPPCTNELLRLDRSTGATISSETGSSVASSAVSAGNAVAYLEFPLDDQCESGPPRLVVRAADTLAPLWTHDFPEQAPVDGPTIAGDQVFVTVGTTLYAFPLACTTPCTPTWTASPGGGLANPVVGNGNEVFVQNDGDTGLVALDRHSGDVLWRVTSEPIGAMKTAVIGDTLYVVRSTELHAYTASGCGAPICEPLWVGPLSGAGRPIVAAAGGVVYVGMDSGVVAFDAAGCGAPSCAPLVTLPTDGGLQEMSVAQGRLFVVIEAEDLAPFRLSSYAPPS